MLFLTRHPAEKIMIYLPSGEEIVILLKDIYQYRGRMQSSIGVHAPKDCKILRAELERRDFGGSHVV